MKNKGFIIFIIILLVCLCIGVTVLFIKLLNGEFNFSKFSFTSESKTLVLDKTYELEFSKIKINTEAGNVYIKTNNENNIKVLIYSEKNANINTNDELNIDVPSKSCHGMCFNQKIARIEVYIPSIYDKQIAIENDYGNIKIDKFMNADIEIIEDSGNVDIEGANYVDIENDYGNITIDKVNSAYIIESAGNVKIGTVDNLKVENDYGNIEIKKVLNHVDIIEDCGNVEIDELFINEDSKIVNNLGNIKIRNTNEIFIKATTDLGKVQINNNYEKSDITLTIENDCGDIKVNN